MATRTPVDARRAARNAGITQRLTKAAELAASSLNRIKTYSDNIIQVGDVLRVQDVQNVADSSVYDHVTNLIGTPASGLNTAAQTYRSTLYGDAGSAALEKTNADAVLDDISDVFSKFADFMDKAVHDVVADVDSTVEGKYQNMDDETKDTYLRLVNVVEFQINQACAHLTDTLEAEPDNTTNRLADLVVKLKTLAGEIHDFRAAIDTYNRFLRQLISDAQKSGTPMDESSFTLLAAYKNNVASAAATIATAITNVKTSYNATS